jgi:glyoxylase-like metal-dependent hydrolase (beta-lactamase superfamily II)/8-oxo-dGTP pyrophosphatase MutT (NUDIX family)
MNNSFTPAVPVQAEAVILLRDADDPKVFWVQRSRQLAFMGGWHAFPGGKCDADDDRIPLHGSTEKPARGIAAIRELFEETGVLLVRGAEKLSARRTAQFRLKLERHELTFSELLERESLQADAALLQSAGRRITPAFMPRRFDTHFFAAWLPPGQEAHSVSGEHESGEWIRPQSALRQWRNGEVLLAEPTLRILQELDRDITSFAERLTQMSARDFDTPQRLEFRQGFILCPLRTPTIPPATHTNCFIVGDRELVVIDPGSPWPEEQKTLDDLLDELLREGRRVREILITHLHPDHIGGVMHLADRFNIPVAAHRLTAAAIAGKVRVDRFIEDAEVIDLGGDPGWKLRALWTPGHARGHLSFYEERTGTLMTGDCVVGLGTVVIAPPEGEMKPYLDSLHRLLTLPRLTALFPAHGPVIADARSRIEEYIRHRYEREAQILEAIASKWRSIPEIVKVIYPDLPDSHLPLAALSIQAHLEKLQAEGRVDRDLQQCFSIRL